MSYQLTSRPTTSAGQSRAGAGLRTLAVVCAGVLLTACEPLVADEGTAPSCGAEQYQALVGQGRTDVIAAGLTPSRDVRIVGPGDAVTMDFRSDRLNVELDDADRVVRIYCG